MHAIESVEPADAEYPAAQFVHEVDNATDQDPAGHVAMEMEEQKLPAPQLVQAAAPDDDE